MADEGGDVTETGGYSETAADAGVNPAEGLEEFDVPEDFYSKYREKRMSEFKQKYEERHDAVDFRNHSVYREITEENFLQEVTESENVICHFYHPEFQRCKIMDKHLSALAPKHFQSKFVKIDVLKAPFFVGKLNVRILPCVVIFKKGVAIDRITGFEEFGGNDDFPTAVIERRLGDAGAIKVKERKMERKKKTVSKGTHNRNEEDSDFSGDDDDL